MLRCPGDSLDNRILDELTLNLGAFEVEEKGITVIKLEVGKWEVSIVEAALKSKHGSNAVEVTNTVMHEAGVQEV